MTNYVMMLLVMLIVCCILSGLKNVLDKQNDLILTLIEDKNRLLETIVELKCEVSRLNGELE